MKVPVPVRGELPNGIVLFLLEDHELPTISVTAMIRTGGRLVPAGKEGLAGITGSVMRTGGTPTRSGNDLDKVLDRLGATVETSIGPESGNASVSVLKEDIDRALPVLADILQNPAFPQDKIDLAKTQIRDSIGRRNDDSHAIAQREFNKLLYGKNSPYARQAEYDSVNSITRDDVIAFHKQYFQPENVILGVYGDFDPAAMRATIDKTFGSWARGGKPKPAVPAVEASANKGTYVINKDDVNQSEVMIGKLGGRLDDPDYCANVVMSNILGGGFDSRLFNSVRSNEGLAYSTGSSWAAAYDHPGKMMATAGTKSGSTIKALILLKKEIGKMSEAEVTEAEFRKAKDAILKATSFDFDSTGKIVNRLIFYEYYGYPKDFLQKYEEGIRKVTKQDVLRVAKQYWNTDTMAVMLFGKTADFDQPVASLGQVSMIDISIPKPKEAAVAAATGESLDKGKQLLMKVKTAMGGDKLSGVKAYSAKGTLLVNTPQGEMSLKTDALKSLDGRSLQKMVTPMGEMTQGFDGEKVWAKTPGGVQEAPAAQVTAAKEEAFRETIFLLQSADKLTVQSLGSSQMGGKAVEGLLVSDPARKLEVKVFVDPQTSFISGMKYTGAGGEIEEALGEYKAVSGVQMPYHVVVSANGTKRAEVKLDEYTLNPPVAANAFAKP